MTPQQQGAWDGLAQVAKRIAEAFDEKADTIDYNTPADAEWMRAASLSARETASTIRALLAQHAADLHAARAKAAREMREKCEEEVNSWADADAADQATDPFRQLANAIRTIALPADDAAALAEFEARVRAEVWEEAAKIAEEVEMPNVREHFVMSPLLALRSVFGGTKSAIAAALRARRGGG